MLGDILVSFIAAGAAALLAPTDRTTRHGRVGWWVRRAALALMGFMALGVVSLNVYHFDLLLNRP